MPGFLDKWKNIIDEKEAYNILPQLVWTYSIAEVYPNKQDVFKAFRIIEPSECRVVFIGQDPYPQRGKATGIVFANKRDTPEEDYSPSLKVIKNSIKSLEKPNLVYNFDPTLEGWAKQGILMLNASLTVEANKVGSHVMMWRKFMTKLVSNLSKYNKDIIFVLFGSLAQTFIPYIHSDNYIVEKHPAYYARTNTLMSSDVFTEINKRLKEKGTNEIEWCQSV